MMKSFASTFFLLLLLFSLSLRAQITNLTDQTSTPIPDVGHDYLKMLNETVNPANGSVSLDLKIPTPTSGVGPVIPVGISYSSNQTYMIDPHLRNFIRYPQRDLFCLTRLKSM